MPVTINQNRFAQPWLSQDPNLYQKYDFYLAALTYKWFPYWSVYDKLFGTQKWTPNMGPVMRGVSEVPTPVSRQTFSPNNITEAPLKDVFEQREKVSNARIKHHLFRSKLIHFLPSWQDFRTSQLPSAVKDIARQVTIANEMFIRTSVLQMAPSVFVMGDTNGEYLVDAPPSTVTSPTPKDTAFFAAMAARVGATCTLKGMKQLTDILRFNICAPAFEGMANSPKPNETIKGRWVVAGSEEAYSNFTFDEHALLYKDLNRDLLNDEFSGLLFGRCAWKGERYPLRMKADGTFPAPEITLQSADGEDSGDTIPNPEYITAPFEWGVGMGAEPIKTISIGAPPKEFAGNVNTSKFADLIFNGKVNLTDNVLIPGPTAGEYDTNADGEFLQARTRLAMGTLPCNRRYAVPFLYSRYNVIESSPTPANVG